MNQDLHDTNPDQHMCSVVAKTGVFAVALKTMSIFQKQGMGVLVRLPPHLCRAVA